MRRTVKGFQLGLREQKCEGREKRRALFTFTLFSLGKSFHFAQRYVKEHLFFFLSLPHFYSLSLSRPLPRYQGKQERRERKIQGIKLNASSSKITHEEKCVSKCKFFLFAAFLHSVFLYSLSHSSTKERDAFSGRNEPHKFSKSILNRFFSYLHSLPTWTKLLSVIFFLRRNTITFQLAQPSIDFYSI